MDRRDFARFKGFSRRAVMLAALKGSLVSALVARLYYLQVVQADRYGVLSDDNRISMRMLPPLRGRVLDRNGEEGGRVEPVLGQVRPGEVGDTSHIRDFLDLAGIEKGPEGVGHLQRMEGGGGGARVMGRHHPGQLETAGEGGDGRAQVQADVARGEGRFVLFQITERPDLGQEDGPPARPSGQGGSKGPRGAAVGQQDDGVGQGLGRMVAQPVQHPGREIVEKGPLGLDREPARAGPGKGIETGGHPPASFASAASRASGSPTCIQSPSSTQP